MKLARRDSSTTMATQPLTRLQTERIDGIFARLDGTTRPGGALGISRAGEPLYVRGYGMSDLQHGVPITPESVFHVASVSKQFTAFAVGLLAVDARISLDDDIRTYIPELPDYGDRITIRHLIYHTSGIRDQWELLRMAGWRYPADLFTQQDVIEIAVRQKALNFKPGDEFVYSNTGYTLLALVVERVTGMPLRAFADQRLFRPLEMTHSHIHDDHAEIVQGRTSAYTTGSSGWKMSVPNFDTHGATSLFTTVGDLLKWGHNFETAKVGSQELLKDATTPAILNSGKSAGYGFGLFIEKYRGADAFGHGGADGGYRADILCLRAHQLVIAVACNFAEATPNLYSRAVAGVLLRGRLERSPPRLARPKAVPSIARLEQLAGFYKADTNDTVIGLSVLDGKLKLDGLGIELQPVDTTRFTMFGMPLEFVGSPDAVPTAVKMPAGDLMVRLPSFQLAAGELGEFVGEYWSDELRVSYRVEQQDDRLILASFKHAPGALRPVAADTFVRTGVGTVRFQRSRGEVSGFQLTGQRVRNVGFVRERYR